MKALFKSKFPFVELPDEELTNEQITIKRTYENTYPIQEETETDRLRNVHGNAGRTRKRADRARNDSSDSDALLQGADEPKLD